MANDRIGPLRNGQQASGTNILQGINERVNRAEGLCRESETIATDALEELSNQRDSLTRARDRLQDADVELNSTNKALKSIYRRLATNKLLLSFIILMELIIIGCQLYLKFIKK